MRNHRHLALLALVCGMGAALALVPGVDPVAAEKPATEYLRNVQVGDPGLKSIGMLNFGPAGLLLVADPQTASFIAVETGDVGPVVKLKQRIDNVQTLLASALGAPADGVQIADMTVNPASGKIYLAVSRKADQTHAILTVDADGKVKDFPLSNVRYVKITAPESDKGKLRTITDLEFAGNRVVVAGSSNEEFASKIYSVPLPLTHAENGTMFSAETYHVAHGRWETRAPIQSFVPHEEDGKQYVVGAFACTPIAKFPLDDIQSESKVRGTSVVELGSGNRPLDMFTYTRDGKKWLVTNTYRFHFQRSKFGPSKWWGVRVSMDYLSSSDINEKAARRDVKLPAGPAGIEIVDALAGAVQVAQIDNDQIIVLRADKETDSEAKLSLELADLP